MNKPIDNIGEFYIPGEENYSATKDGEITEECEIIALVKTGDDDEARKLSVSIGNSAIADSAIAYREQLLAKFENIKSETVQSVEHVLGKDSFESENTEEFGLVEEMKYFFSRCVFLHSIGYFSPNKKQKLINSGLDIKFAEKFAISLSKFKLSFKDILFLLQNGIDTKDEVELLFLLFPNSKNPIASIKQFILEVGITLVKYLIKTLGDDPNYIRELMEIKNSKYNIQEILNEAVVLNDIFQERFDLDWFKHHVEKEPFLSKDYAEYNNTRTNRTFVDDLIAYVNKWHDMNQ